MDLFKKWFLSVFGSLTLGSLTFGFFCRIPISLCPSKDCTQTYYSFSELAAVLPHWGCSHFGLVKGHVWLILFSPLAYCSGWAWLFDHSLITCHSTSLIYFLVINWLLLTNSLCLWVILTCDFSCPFGTFSHALIVLDAFVHLNSLTIVKCDLSSPWIFVELLLFYDIRLLWCITMMKVIQSDAGSHKVTHMSFQIVGKV